jgi:hypothetical protein
MTRRIFTGLLVEHGVDHPLQLLDGPYLHAQALRLVQDVTAVGLFEGGIEDGLLVLQLSRVDGALVGG